MDVKLVMFKSDGQRKEFPISSPTVTLGRSEDCGLQIPLLSVSRRHCELSIAGQELKVKDPGSSNGTYVNNERISEEVILKAGDHLVIGPIAFTIQIDGQPEEITQIKTKGQKMAEEGLLGEEVGVDLDAEPISHQADAGEVDIAPETTDDSDPISALEALAAESTDDEDQEQTPS